MVLRVSVELPPAVTELGLKEAVAPEGSPEALKVTDCGFPLITVVLMVEVPLWPWTTDRLFGLALIAKSSGRVTVSAIAVLWVTEAPVPVTVTV